MRIGILCLTACLFSVATPAWADDDTPSPSAPPEKSNAFPEGIKPGLRAIVDGFGTLSGGDRQNFHYLDNLSLTAAFDGEKLFGATGLKAFVNLMRIDSGQPDGASVGTYGIYNNIEATPSATRVYEAWLQQSVFDDHASLRAGLYDLNTEFYLTDSSAHFVHSTFGIGSEFGDSGVSGPSIFPLTGLAARIRVNPTRESYGMVAVLDGTPGDPDHPHGTHIDLGKGGALLVTEWGLTPGKIDEGDKTSVPNKYAVGAWLYTKRPDEFDGTGTALPNPNQQHSDGVYVITQRRLQDSSKENHAGQIDAFARAGFADAETNIFDTALSVGITLASPFGEPDGTEIGLGLHNAHKSEDFRRASGIAGKPQRNWEGGAELYYRLQALEWVALQPDLQYLTNPDLLGRKADAVVAGLRLDASF